MARKKKQLPQATTDTSPWQDLPRKLVNSLTRPPISMWSINYNVAAKSWKLSPKRCNNIIRKSTSSLPQLHSTKDRNTFQPRMHTFSFLKGASCFPPWENNAMFKHIALFFSSEDYHNHFAKMVVEGIFHPTFMLYTQTKTIVSSTMIRPKVSTYKRDVDNWFSEEFALIHTQSFSRRHLQLTNSIWFNGKFYALSLQGTLVIIEEVDSHLVITHVSSSRAVPTVISRHFRECLIRSNSEIFLIFLISTQSSNTVDDVEIFRFELTKLAWEKVERLGDRAAFIGANYCLIVKASEAGCKSSCVYFTNTGADGWWVYDMARADISPSSSRSDSTRCSVWDD